MDTSKITDFLCTTDGCGATVEILDDAIRHVEKNDGHQMTKTIDDEGNTLTVSVDGGDDEWDDDDDEDEL